MTSPHEIRMNPCACVIPIGAKPAVGPGIGRLQWFRMRPPVSDVTVITVRPILDDGTEPAASLVLATSPDKEPMSHAPDGFPPVAFEADGGVVRGQVALPEGSSFYGTGEVTGPLLRTGRATMLWNTDAWGYAETMPVMYQSHPYVLGVLPDGRAVGVLADTIRRGCVVCAPNGVELQFEEDPYDVHVILGESPLAVSEALSALIGRIRLPPLYALGYHQCRWSYMTADEVRDVARNFRERKIPCDVIWFDIDYMDGYRCFTWDPARFADPRGLTDELHRSNFRSIVMLDPGLAVGDDPITRSGLDGEHFVIDAKGRPFQGRVWPGICHFPDFTRPETRLWWGTMVGEFADRHGIDGVWNDMNEPSVFGVPTKTMPEDVQHRGAGGGPHKKFHNAYGMFMAQASHEGLAAARPDRRPFVLTRSNHIAGSRFAATWTGDNQALWEDLRWSITMTLNLGLSGQPFSGPDIGGFAGNPTPELFTRWFELGAYLPFCRGHGHKHDCRKEPWSFGPEAEAHVRAALERRMRLMPYLYTLFRSAEVHGHPIVRPLFFADPRDAALRAIEDCFLLGGDLLVAPVTEPGQTTKHVTFPGVGWYLFPSGGPMLLDRKMNVSAPLGSTPVFARAGSIVPEGPLREFTMPSLHEPITLHVFLDAKGRATGRLYEDDGESNAHLRGEFRDTHYVAQLDGRKFTLTASRTGKAPAPSRRRTVIVHAANGTVARHEDDDGARTEITIEA